jgi:hypothetical protein
MVSLEEHLERRQIFAIGAAHGGGVRIGNTAAEEVRDECHVGAGANALAGRESLVRERHARALVGHAATPFVTGGTRRVMGVNDY